MSGIGWVITGIIGAAIYLNSGHIGLGARADTNGIQIIIDGRLAQGESQREIGFTRCSTLNHHIGIDKTLWRECGG